MILNKSMKQVFTHKSVSIKLENNRNQESRKIIKNFNLYSPERVKQTSMYEMGPHLTWFMFSFKDQR
jgi:hypothetical protein